MLSFIGGYFVQCTAPASLRQARQPAASKTRPARGVRDTARTAAPDDALRNPSEPGDGEQVRHNVGGPMERRRAPRVTRGVALHLNDGTSSKMGVRSF